MPLTCSGVEKFVACRRYTPGGMLLDPHDILLAITIGKSMSSNPEQKGLSANLDLLRAIAVLLVLAQHFCTRNYVDKVLWMPTSSWGLFGVLLFFVHTCLVLMYSLERSGLKGRPLIANFAIRRIFRIYPLSVIAVLVALLLHLDSGINGIRGLSHGQLPGIVSIASNLLLVQNLTYVKSIVNVLWSLPFELQMYAFLPFLFLWIHGRKATWQLLCFWAIGVGLAIIQPRLPSLGRLSILAFSPCFLPGVIAYSLPYRQRFSSRLWPIFIVILILAFAVRPQLSTGWFLCLALGLMVPSFREIQAPWLRLASHKIATYSYGIYISHQFCIWLVFGPLARASLVFRIPLLVALLAGLPFFLYHAIERPMIRVGACLGDRVAETLADSRPHSSDFAIEPPASSSGSQQKVSS